MYATVDFDQSILNKPVLLARSAALLSRNTFIAGIFSATAILLFFMASSILAMAETTSGNFTAGITIGNPQNDTTSARRSSRFRYTWGAAEVTLQRAGYAEVRRISKSDDLYWFSSEDGGRPVRLAVSTVSGEIVNSAP